VSILLMLINRNLHFSAGVNKLNWRYDWGS
jgi:hypothetical protein